VSVLARTILTVAAALLAMVAAISTLYVLGVRSRSTTMRHVARRFHHVVGNRVQMRSAGAPGAFASVIRHRGRTSGTTYQTPVWAAPTDDGFVIALVYGTGCDWLKNVMRGGPTTIVHRGHTYPVGRPQIIPMADGRRYFPTALQQIHRRLRIDRCLHVQRLAVAGESRERAGSSRGAS
jgi:hypothetical protein